MTILEFTGFDMANIRKQLNILFILISLGEPHCLFAPTLPQWPSWGSQVGNLFPFGALKAPLSPSCSPSKGPHRSRESLIDIGAHQKVRELL